MKAKKFTQRLDDLSPEILSDDPRGVLKEMIEVLSETGNERLEKDISNLLQRAEGISKDYINPADLDWSWFNEDLELQ